MYFLITGLLATASNLPSVVSLPTNNTNSNTTAPLVNYGMVIFPAFQALDVFGPADALNVLSQTKPLNLAIIGPTLDPVSTQVKGLATRSNFSQSVVPTHTFDNPPKNLDVLILPGGAATLDLEDPVFKLVIQYVKDAFPSVQYFLTVCTGSWIAAEAGVLDGHKATSNKAGWDLRPMQNGSIEWISHARWVEDGKVWTSSGVSAGLDLALAFVAEKYGEDVALGVANDLEYERETDPSRDPFADLYGL